MTVDASPLPVVHSRAVEQLSPLVPAVDAALEQRWAAWRQRGLRHDVAVQRRIRWIASIVAIATALVAFGRVIAGASQ